MQLTKFDALAVLIAAATGLVLAEDCSRTEIVVSQERAARPRYSAASLVSVWRSERSVMRADLPRRLRR
jgi:hypothetical protein